ncbi:MAG: valine--tRNA ligase, partial [Myxococcaceae bacterium]
HDIIFFWVARMMMMGLHFMGDVPFRTVYLHAMVRDEKGEKMSKTKGNVIDPLDVILGAKVDALQPSLRNRFPQGMPAFGADALRFTLASLTQQGRDIKLSMDRLGGYKAFCNKLWNASRFALMNMGDFSLDKTPLEGRTLTLADRWILSRLQKATVETRASLEVYGFAEAASTLYQFLWAEFCDWYIELAKGSLYGEDPEAKDTTRAVLVYCLDRILRLMHPFMPFITEEIWQKLPMSRPTESICIAAYPEPDTARVDASAEAEMAPVIAAIEGVRTLRGESNLPPSAKVKAVVQSPDATTRELLERWRAYLMPLAGLSEVQVGPPGAKPPQAAAFVSGNLEIYVPLAGLVDLDAERDRLKKEIARAEQELTSVQRKLDNPSFVARAPPDVVAKDQARVAELQERTVKLQDHLQRIAPEPPMSEPETPSPLPVSTESESSTLAASESAHVKVATEPKASKDDVNLGQELKGEMEAEAAGEPAQPADPVVEDALNKLREGTREGLSPADHHDLGVAYMSMGLVDDAMREFDRAKEGGDTREAPENSEGSVKKPAGKKAAAAKKAPAKKAAAKKAPAKKAPAKKAAGKKSAAKKAPAKKAAGKKSAAKKAPAKKAAGKKAAVKKGGARKAPARKTSAKAAGKKAGAKKAPAKKTTRGKPAARKARR